MSVIYFLKYCQKIQFAFLSTDIFLRFLRSQDATTNNIFINFIMREAGCEVWAAARSQEIN